MFKVFNVKKYLINSEKIILEHIEEYIIMMIWTKIGKRYKTIVKYLYEVGYTSSVNNCYQCRI